MRIDVTAISVWLLLAATFVAVYFDVRVRRIPNWLTGSLVVAAIALHAMSGIIPLAVAVGVIVLMTLLGLLMYSRGGIAGGDVKLLIAGSGLLSFPLFIPFLLYTMIGGGLLAVGYVIRNRSYKTTLEKIAVMTATGTVPVTTNKNEMMPYAIAFAFGALIVALSQSYAPFLRITV